MKIFTVSNPFRQVAFCFSAVLDLLDLLPIANLDADDLGTNQQEEEEEEDVFSPCPR